MKVRIDIETDNAAFSEGNNGTETARILRNLADRIDGEELSRYDCRLLLDLNGNRVGQFTTAGGAKKFR